LGLVGLLALAGCGGSSSNNSPDAKIPDGGHGGAGGTDGGTLPGGAILTLSAGSVDLGSVDVGTTSTPRTVTVTNAGTALSGQLTVVVSGTGVTATGCTGTLAVGATCTITISATPAVAGAISGTVSVSEGTNPAKTIQVSGIATVPGQFSLTPNSIDLGNVLINGTATGSVTVTNSALTGLTGFVITVDGTGFTQAGTSTCTASLPVGQTCTIDVSFTGATAGSATGHIIVSQGGVTKSVVLSAKVQSLAKLAMTPLTAAFTATAGVPSSPVTFYVTNGGDVASGVPTVTLTGANAGDFAIGPNTCTTAIPGGAIASCQIAVVFSPKAASATNETATLTVTDSGAGASSVVATLTGTAIAPSTLALTGGPDLGSVVVGATGTAVSFTLKNNGGNNSGAIGITPSDGQFVLSADTCSTTDLKPAATCTFSLQLKPAAGAVGVLTGRVTATGAATANPTALTITGTAIPASNLVASPTVLNFGSIPTSQESAPLTLTITNNGGATSGVLTQTNTGAQFAVKSDLCSGSTLAAGASCTISVTFTATGTDTTGVEATGTVSVTDGKTTASVALQGSGINHPTVQMLPSVICPQYTEDDVLCTASNSTFLGRFQNKAVGHGTKELTLTVTNLTDPTLAPDSGVLTFAITGAAAADFKIVQNNCTTALVSTSTHTTCLLTIAVTPSAVGLRKALLVLTTSRGGASQTTLEAKGLAPIEVQPLQVSKTKTGLDFGTVALGHNDPANDSLPYRIWVRDTTSADSNTTVTVLLPTPSPADFVWPNTSATLSLPFGSADDVLTPPVGFALSFTTGTDTFAAPSGVNPCSNKTLALSFKSDGVTPTAGTSQSGYTFDTASGYWYCDFPVEFYPQSGKGPLTADLNAAGSGGGTSKITLTGNAGGPLVVTPSPALLASPVAVGLGSSTNITLTVTNQSATVTEGNLTFALSGTGSADFQILGTTCWTAHSVGLTADYPAVLDKLAPGEHCLVWVGFQPTTQAAYSVTFTATAANGPGATDDEKGSTTLQSTGSKTFGAITVTPNPGTFADTAYLKTDATPVTFTVKNNGTLDTGPATLTLSDPANFEIVSPLGATGACNVTGSWTVPGGGSCTVQVRAKPTALPAGVGKQLINATLTATATPGGTVIVPLTYYETSNLMVNGASTAVYAFDAAGVGTQVSQNFTVSNLGSVAVSLSFVNPAGTSFAVDETVTGLTPVACKTGASILAAGAQCTLVVKNSNSAPGLVGVPTPKTLQVVDTDHAANNFAKVLLSSNTLANSKLVTYGIPGNTNAEAGTASTGRISLGTVPFSQGQGAPITVWFQNQGGVATQPLHFRWDSPATAGAAPAPAEQGAADAANAEFVLTSLYPENPQACLSGTASGGQKVPPLGLCSVTFYFKPSLSNPTNVAMRYRDLVVLDVTTAPEVYVQANPTLTLTPFVQEVTGSTNEGFFQFTAKTPPIGVTPQAPETHVFVVTNPKPTTDPDITITLPSSSGGFTFTTNTTLIAPVTLTNPCGATLAGGATTCQFAVVFVPTAATPIFPWISTTVGGAGLGLMGRAQQSVTLQINRAPSAPSCVAITPTPVPVGGETRCVDFTTVAVGGTTVANGFLLL
jgi:hypothetical protein